MAVRSSSIGPGRNWFERFFWPGRNPEGPGANLSQREDKRKAFMKELERFGFRWDVFAVAASGFFTDSYNLFSSNVVLPALAFVYWDGPNHDKALAFNLATLGASALGQLVFGVFADMFGRRSLYGVELIIVIISTVGLLQCSPGYIDSAGNSTWDVTSWILFWRTIMGFGIGAEYPLSACIAAEWSSTKSRGRTMAAVFLMQPLGQLCAYGAGLTALRCFGTSKVDIDKLWRYVIGVGTIPTLLALCFRIWMPESGRYTYEVCKNDDKASLDNGKMFANNMPSEQSPDDMPKPDVPESTWNQFRWSEIWNYVYHQGNWVYLFGTSLCWLLLDFPFYGLGFNNPSTMAKLWSSTPLNFPTNPPAPWWLKTSDVVNSTIDGIVITNGLFPGNHTIATPLIHQVLENNMLHAIYTVSIASITGSILMIAFIDHFDRKTLLTTTFFIVGLVLIVVSTSFKSLFQNDLHVILIMFWVIISFLFSFGPNTLTFIIPAEIFPTRYRCTFYGIAAASGKLGAVLVQIVLLTTPSIGRANSADIRWLLLGFAFCMLLGAAVSHYTIPHVQKRGARSRFEDLPLEELPPREPKIGWRGLRIKDDDHD